MTDELIILLSADWFLPYWARIGAEVEEAKKRCIQRGCRSIVSQIFGDAQRMYQVDFSDERKLKTEAHFGALLLSCAAHEELAAARKQWGTRTDEDNRAEWSWYHLNSVICSPRVEERFPLLPEDLRSCISEVWSLYDFRESDLRTASSSSSSEWDLQIHSVVGGANVLYGLLDNVLQGQKLQAFWGQLQARLTAVHISVLIDWYREATLLVTRGEQPDLIPSFVKQRFPGC